jgi:hypothetical protein
MRADASMRMRFCTDNTRNGDPNASQPVWRAQVMSCVYQLALGNMGHGWSSIVKPYSRLRLTYESDRLPALSGLASQYSGLCSAKWTGSTLMVPGPDGVYVPKDPQPSTQPDLRLRYLGGIWEFELPANILWHRIHDSVSAAESEHYKWRYDGNYRAPTWSWAAGVGPVDFMAIPQEEVKDALAIAQIESIEYRLKGRDPHGDGESASIALKSMIVEGELVWTDKQVPQMQITKGGIKTLVDIKLDFRTPEEGAKVYGSKVERVFLLKSTAAPRIHTAWC